MNDEKRGVCRVDVETQLELEKNKNEIIIAVEKIFRRDISKLEKTLRELNDTRFASLEKTIDRHEKQIEETYSELKLVDGKITKSRDSILKLIEGKNRFRWEILISTAAVIIAAIALITAFI